ncbi:MAG: CDP-glycerol glycerophosphotransferase family protein [Proteobacteria bacterium]|nr:CDP-glycerol glycerophosphotransferase family protein [Pseudomonadota bacterium]
MRPLQAAIRARGDEAAWFFDGPGADELVPGERVLGSVDEVMDFSPAAVFAPGNHVPGFFPGVKVAVFHGFDAGKPKHVYVRGFYDLYCTTGPGDTAAFERLADSLGYFGVKETGWPKLDPYAGFASSRAGDKPVVLYHSTFSPSWSAAGVLFEQVRRMSVTGRWRWIVCLHPKTNGDTVARYRSLVGENLEFSEDDNILDVFPRADVMVSDTSSALSEFLLWQKPVVTFKNRRPGPELIDIDDPAVLESAIERALQRPAGLMAAIKEYTDAIHPARDGRSSERVLAAVDEFIAESSGKLQKKPLNLWRNWRVRRRLARLGV